MPETNPAFDRKYVEQAIRISKLAPDRDVPFAVMTFACEMCLAEIGRLQTEIEMREAGKLRFEKYILEVEAKLADAIEILGYTESKHPEAIEMIKKHDFVFRTNLSKVVEHPNDQKTAEEWEKLAFSLYSDICDMHSRIQQFRAEYPELNGDV